MISWERIERWDYVVLAVATEYYRRFPMLEYDDIKQSLYMWFMEHPNKLNEWESIGDKDAKNLIYRSLRNQALDYCQKAKAKISGYEASDVYYYEADIVEALLPSVLRGEINLGHKLDLGRQGSPSAPSEGGNLMSMMIEIDYAYWKLKKDERRLLFLRYAVPMDFKEIANILELGSEDTARMRQRRALNKLIRKLGGFSPYRDYDLNNKDENESSNKEEGSSEVEENH